MSELVENAFGKETVTDVNCVRCFLNTVHQRVKDGLTQVSDQQMVLNCLIDLKNLPGCDLDEASRII